MKWRLAVSWGHAPAAWSVAVMCSWLLVFSSAVRADEPQAVAQASIEVRQAGFKKMGAALKAITEQLKSEAPVSARLAAPAEAILSGAHKVSQWFPGGSGHESGAETDALPNIWTERARFDELARELVTEAKSLSTALAANDAGAIRAQAKRVASACSSCHRSFRAD